MVKKIPPSFCRKLLRLFFPTLPCTHTLSTLTVWTITSSLSTGFLKSWLGQRRTTPNWSTCGFFSVAHVISFSRGNQYPLPTENFQPHQEHSDAWLQLMFILCVCRFICVRKTWLHQQMRPWAESSAVDVSFQLSPDSAETVEGNQHKRDQRETQNEVWVECYCCWK